MYEYKAQVIGVYDGDSITVDIDLGFGVFLKGQKIRLLGIDTPEIRGEERPIGLVARDALRARIMGQSIIIKTHKDTKGKYGRWLGEVLLGPESINEWLLSEGFANPY